MKKAEWKGECQICGRRQMLPGGLNNRPLLSLHGYTTRWGFFNGVCPGSREVPYEQSCDLLPPRILAVEADIVRLSKWELEVRAAKTVVWVREWVKPTGHLPSQYIWREIPIGEMVEIGYTTRWTGKDGQEQRANVYGKYDRDSAIAELNGKRADDIHRIVKQHRDYRTWAIDRVKLWKLKGLVKLDRSKDRGQIVHVQWQRSSNAYCGGNRFGGSHKVTTIDFSKVNCTRCLKALANPETAAHIARNNAAPKTK